MAYWVFDSRAVFLLSALVCACGGSSESTGAGGASAASSGNGGVGNGASGSNGHAGSSTKSNAGSSAVLSAGSGGTGATCPTFTPCGGDVLGDWTIKDFCLGSAMSDALSEFCPGATVSVGPIMATGTLSFKADGTEVGSATLSYQGSVHIPADCYTEANCATYETALNTVNGVSTASCSWDAATGCSCAMSINQAPSMGSGTYQVQGTDILFTSSDSGNTSVSNFCVSGNTLRIVSADAGSTLTSSITLTR